MEVLDFGGWRFFVGDDSGFVTENGCISSKVRKDESLQKNVVETRWNKRLSGKQNARIAMMA